MIISRWRGFEIDSSEGYYGFCREMEHVDDGWNFMARLLGSPLVWIKVAFSLTAVRKKARELGARVEEFLEAGRIESAEDKYPYCQFAHAARIPVFLELIEPLRNLLRQVEVNFCLAPISRMPVEESENLRKWFRLQFQDERRAKERWQDYLRVREKHFMLRGNNRATDEWLDVYAFEGNFCLLQEKPFSYAVYLSAGDPSLMIHFLETLTANVEIEYFGDHYISINLTPDRLNLSAVKNASERDEESKAENDEPPDES
jgi:hypothetical protein